MSDQNDMLLRGPGGWLRLSLLQYQFPDNVSDDYDSNWLIVGGEACIDSREWRFREPCLLTFEVAQLATWLEQVSRGQAESPFCGFVEPCLEFNRSSEQSIRIGFAIEAAPPWAGTDDDWYEYGIEVPVGPELERAAVQLRQQLVRFPVRGPRGNRSD